jgi:hypothetical protein
LAQRSSRKRRKERQRAAAETSAHESGVATAEATEAAPPQRPATTQEFMERGYARGRAKDAEARAKLKPLAKGERPRAVTVGAIVAAVAAAANLISLALAFDPDEAGKSVSTLLGAFMMIVIAVGMWRARYWAVLGLQALLALTIIAAALAMMLANSLWAATLAFLILAGSGTLFWFLVKAMARIQMPKRPGQH